MAFDLIVIDIPELGQRLQISRATYYKILLAGAYFDIGEFNGTNFPQQEERRTVNEHVLTLPKICDYIPAWITKEEKLKRMRRGWHSYRVPVIVSPVRRVWRCVQSNLGARNIGCLNFRKM